MAEKKNSKRREAARHTQKGEEWIGLGVYKKLFDEALDAVFIADAKTGILVECNRAACELVGRKKSELIGKYQRILHPSYETNGGFSRTFKQHLKEKQGQILESQVITKKGEIKDVIIKANLLVIKGRKLLQGIFHDITEQKRTEKRLRESEKKYKASFDNARDAINVFSKDKKFLDVNKRMIQLSGYSKKEFLSMKLKDLFPEASKPATQKRIKAMLQGKEPPLFETELVTKKRRRVPVEIGVTSLRNCYGQEVVFQGNIRDITEQKKTKETILRAYKTQSDIAENAPFGIFTINKKGVVDYVNPAMLRISGDKRGEFMGMNILKLPTYVKLGLAKKIKECFRGKPFFVGPLTYTSNYSRKRTVRNFTGLPMRGKHGRVEKVMVFVEDITEMKEAEDALHKEKNRVQQYFDVAGVLLMIVDSDQKIVNINRKGCEILGYKKKEELIGKSYFNTFIPERLRNDVLRIFKLLMAGKVEPAEYFENPVLVKSGEERILAWHNTVLKNEQGKIYAVLCSGEDITERKKIEEELKKRSAELERFNKLAIGRELKMVELKKRIKELEGKLKK